MNILIVGAGVVGSNLARQLSLEHQNISLVDADASRLDAINQRIDCLTVLGDGATPSVLERAGIAHADMVIAVSDSDSVNLVICALAERYGVKRKIARVRNPEYRDFVSRPVRNKSTRVRPVDKKVAGPLGEIVDTIINPDLIIVSALQQFIDSPGATEVADFGDGAIHMRRFPITGQSPLAGLTMKELGKYTSVEPFLVVAIQRGTQTIIPRGDDRIEPGDDIVMVMPDGVQPMVLPLVGSTINDVQKVIIDGTTPVALELARRLEEMGVGQIWLIEGDQQRAHEAADQLGRARVVVGRSTDPALHAELGTDVADYFVALGENDEHSLLGALLARKLGARRTAILVREVEYIDILQSIGIDIAVNSRLLTTSAILRYIRRGSILSVARFLNDQAEAIELLVDEKARISGKPLMEIGLEKNIIIGAVQRDDDVFLPNGQTVILPGDHVTVFTLADKVGRVEKLFDKRGLFG